MSPIYTDESRAAARERMRLLRAKRGYTDEERSAARDRIWRLRHDPSYVRKSDRPKPEPRQPVYTRKYKHISKADMALLIGKRPYVKLYDSWNVHRKRALTAGEAPELLLTIDQWSQIVQHYGDVCLCCGEAVELTFDHTLPASLGGTFTADNMQPLCSPCNMHKHARYIDYRPDQGFFGRSLMSVLSANT